MPGSFALGLHTFKIRQRRSVLQSRDIQRRRLLDGFRSRHDFGSLDRRFRQLRGGRRILGRRGLLLSGGRGARLRRRRQSLWNALRTLRRRRLRRTGILNFGCTETQQPGTGRRKLCCCAKYKKGNECDFGEQFGFFKQNARQMQKLLNPPCPLQGIEQDTLSRVPQNKKSLFVRNPEILVCFPTHRRILEKLENALAVEFPVGGFRETMQLPLVTGRLDDSGDLPQLLPMTCVVGDHILDHKIC